MRRLRLLFLLPFPPRLDGLHGGARVAAHLLIGVAKDHDVGILYLRSPGEAGADPVVTQACVFAEEFLTPDTRTKLAHALRSTQRSLSVLAGRPRWVTNTAAADLARRIPDCIESWQPDLVQAEFHVMGQYLDLVDPSVPRVLNQHEAGAAAAREEYERTPGSGMRRFLNWADAAGWENFERRVMRKADVVVVFSEDDRMNLSHLVPYRDIVTIPFGTAVPDHALDPVGAQPESIVFVGSFIHLPNVDAAMRLIDGIYPRLRGVFPDLGLSIVGSSPPPALVAAAGNGVIVTGTVPDVTPYLDRATVVVVPLRLGGGMRVKVVEALAAGKAVVSSRRAAAGVGVTDGEHLLLAETDSQFADRVGELLRDPERRAKLAAGARAWAEENLGWERTIAAYEDLYARLIASPAISPAVRSTAETTKPVHRSARSRPLHRVVWFSHTASIGGAEFGLVEAIRALRMARVSSHVVVPERGPLVKLFAEQGIPTTIVPYRWWMSRGDSLTRRARNLTGLVDPRTWAMLTRLIRALQPDLVVTNTSTIPAGALIARAQRLPHAWFVREFGRADHDMQFELGERVSYRLIDRLSDAVVVHSEALAEYLREQGVRAEKIRVIRYAVIVDEVARRAPSASNSALRLLQLGTVTPRKGPEEAIRAVAAANAGGRQVSLRLVGAAEPGYAARLQALATGLGVAEHVELVSFTRDPSEAILRADALLVCSNREAFGRTTIEAMKLGKPVIGAASGATAELIQDGSTGLLYRSGDVHDLTGAIEQLYDDRKLLQTFGENGRRWANDRYNLENYAADLIEVLNSVQRARRGP
jgi:glycosyltransferase involved in cell wall biosynthesis